MNEVERQGLVSLQILIYYIVITSQMRLLALIEPAEVIGLANVVTRSEQAVCNFHLMKVSKLRTIDESSLQCWKMWSVSVETYTTWNGSAMSRILSLTNLIMYSLDMLTIL